MAGIMNCFDDYLTSIDNTLTESGIFHNKPSVCNNSNDTIIVDCPDEEYIPPNQPRTIVMHRQRKHLQPTTECVDEEHSIHG